MKTQMRFSDYMIRLGRHYDLHQVFTDFLELTICALSLGAMEERYLQLIGRYEKPEAYAISEALGALVMEMDDGGEGLKDCFGDFFMEHLSHGRNGQFFTPQPVCDLMAEMSRPTKFGERVADCCCGSGRLLMAAAKINRNALFFGADIDRTCCMMCLVNLCLNGLLGEVAWMDALTNNFYGAWRVELHPEHAVPYIRQIGEDESYLLLKMPETKKQLPPPAAEAKAESTQQLLFEF